MNENLKKLQKTLAALYEDKKIIKKVETKNYDVEDYKNPPKKEIKKDKDGKPIYRTKKIKDKDGNEILIKFAVMKNVGPEGGRTKITSLWKKK